MSTAWLYPSVRWGVAAMVGLVVADPSNSVRAGEATPFTEIRLTLDIRELPLDQALKRVADSAGQKLYPIPNAETLLQRTAEVDGRCDTSIDKLLRRDLHHPFSQVVLFHPGEPPRVVAVATGICRP